MTTKTLALSLSALGIVCAVFLYYIQPILMPFLVAALLAYVSDPLVEGIQRFKIPRTLAVVCVFIIFITIILIALLVIVPVLERQIGALIDRVPDIIDWLQNTAIPWVSQRTGIDASQLNMDTVKRNLSGHWQQAGGAAAWAMHYMTSSGLAIIAVCVNLVLIPVVLFYLLRDWHRLLKKCHDLLPRSSAPTIVRLVHECDNVLSAFLRGQLSVMACLGIIYAAGLSLIGLQMGLLIGVLSGLFSIVPYLGFITGITTASIVAVVQFHDWTHLLLVWLVYAIGQMIESMVLTPLLVGHRIGLHPVAVIFAIMAGGELFGFVGILLALPAAAVISVLIRYIHGEYRGSRFYRAK